MLIINGNLLAQVSRTGQDSAKDKKIKNDSQTNTSSISLEKQTNDKVVDTSIDSENKKPYSNQNQLDSARKNRNNYLYKQYFFKTCSKTIIQWFYIVLAIVVFLFLWFLFFYYLNSSSLCKDPSYDSNGKLLPATESPYSYARVQLLWWTMIILSCYIIFFGVTGILIPFNETIVILLGLGATVYGSGKILDNRQIDNSKGYRSQDIDAQDKNLKPNILRDILSDDNGISIHRFQAVIFNLVFSIGFIAYFIQSLNSDYPFIDFTDWQFALIGISSATYLGLKASENNNTSNKPKPVG